jgi:hypothetical protein
MHERKRETLKEWATGKKVTIRVRNLAADRAAQSYSSPGMDGAMRSFTRGARNSTV